jgi:transposase-like protein
MRQCKYLNIVVEQDHRAIRRVVRPMLGSSPCVARKPCWRALRRCT